jgi:FKBP-type peptidyl-prolyl cis-trans isomerase FkpA/FKBP-type peptidyl-prolyl cis-trans isomerase FklB
MRSTVLATLAVVVFGAGDAASALELKTDEQKTLYALGLALSRNLGSFALTEAELELVKAGLTDGVLNREKKVDAETFGPKLMELQKTRAAAVAAGEKKTAQAFLDKAATEKGAKKTASGLVISTIKAGTGEAPKAADRVKVHYHGTLTDGSVFDSSVQRGQPATFALGQVIPCWTEGLQLMRVGGKSRLVCPSDIAYGDRGAPPRIRPGAALVFEVELLEILK